GRLARPRGTFRDATLIKHLDRAGMKTAGSRSIEILTVASLHDDDIDARQRQLARQHQSGRTASCDHHRMLSGRHHPAAGNPPSERRFRAIHLPSSQSNSSTAGGMSAQRNCCMSSEVVPRRRWNMSIWTAAIASTNSPNAAQFICLLSKLDVVKTVSVSLRHSNAPTMSMNAKEVNAIDWPISTLPKCDLPNWMSESNATVMANPTSPTVTRTGRVSTDSPRGRGRRAIRPGVSRSKPSAKPNAALTKKWIHSTWAGVNGSPEAMLNNVAPRNETTNTTSRMSTKRMYFVRLS